jgi:hypothetical protein
MAAAGMTMAWPTVIPYMNPMVFCSLPNPTYGAAGVEEDSAPSGVKHEP